MSNQPVKCQTLDAIVSILLDKEHHLLNLFQYSSDLVFLQLAKPRPLADHYLILALGIRILQSMLQLNDLGLIN
jgi:hypothetical protein